MPKVRLINSSKASGSDEFQLRFSKYSDNELIDAFNSQVNNRGWVSAKGSFLSAIHDEFIKRGIDYSAIGDVDSMSVDNKIKLEGKRMATS